MRQIVITVLVALFISPLLVMGCEEQAPQQWTQPEKENVIHFIKSVYLVEKAEDVSGKRAMRKLYEQAVNHAETVTDDILEKANPDLPHYYREYFEKGVNLRLIGWRDGKADLDQEGAALIAKWNDWYKQNRQKIDIYI